MSGKFQVVSIGLFERAFHIIPGSCSLRQVLASMFASKRVCLHVTLYSARRQCTEILYDRRPLPLQLPIVTGGTT